MLAQLALFGLFVGVVYLLVMKILIPNLQANLKQSTERLTAPKLEKSGESQAKKP